MHARLISADILSANHYIANISVGLWTEQIE